MKVIQAGMGGMGNAWLHAVRNSQQVDFAGFVEINDEIARQQSAAYGLDLSTVYRTLPEALRHLDADAVINVTPPQFHKEISIAALEAGLPVMSEKPLADTLDAARAIVAKSNETGVTLSVGQNYRHFPLTRTIKGILDSGELGALTALQVGFYKGPHFGGFREQMPHPLTIDMAIHHFDMMRYFLDSDAQWISARSWNPPWSWYAGDASLAATIQFANGAVASYSGSWCSQALETTWNGSWRFECERGALLVEDDIITIQRLLNVGDGPDVMRNEHDDKRIVPIAPLPRAGQDSLLQEFYEAVTGGKSTLTSAQDNIRTMELVFGVVKACESGDPVRLD